MQNETNSNNKSGMEKYFFRASAEDFKKIPGSPIAYWMSDVLINLFSSTSSISQFADTRKGMATGLNDVFVRQWHEISISRIGFGLSRDAAKKSTRKYFPYANGGEYRKWYGNYSEVVDWENDGCRLQTEKHETGRIRAVNLNLDFIFKEGLSWTSITSSVFSIRILPCGFLFSSASNALFAQQKIDLILCLLNSNVHLLIGKILNPTLNANPGDVSKVPLIDVSCGTSKLIIEISKLDWDAFETSWDFQALPWLPSVLPDYLKNTGIAFPDRHSLASCWDTWRSIGQHWTAEMLRLEEENNRLFIDAYGLQDELTADVPIEQITLTVNPWYRYKPRKKAAEDESSGPGIEAEILDEGGSPNQECNEEPGAERNRSAGPLIYPEGEERMREDGARELVSYAIGCAMGRYSLDKRGLIYAEAGGQGFDHAQYPTFPADDDGILCITDMRWFDDDGADRVETFVRTAWGAERHDENMTALAGGLGVKGNESPDETLRRYLSGDFYKDHLQTYKKRPIYWKFSSGKEKAFEALVYLHRYNKGTLSRMRMQFVVPLSGKIRGQMDGIEAQIQGAASTAERKRLDKLKASLNAKLAELTAFDSVLNHYAQMQIELDLDDGVRVNYGKFGALLANVKDVVGKGEE
jgi:hypothetical protein